MKDRFEILQKAWPDRDPFQGAATAYIRHSENNPPTWEYLEKPLWEGFFKLCDSTLLGNMLVLDVGSGVGKIPDLAINLGVKRNHVFALEPNPILASYLKNKNLLTIKDVAQNLNAPIMQLEQFDLVTANLVLNHFSTKEFTTFVATTSGVVIRGGAIAYTIPHPGSKAIKHDIRPQDNHSVFEEKVPWGGYAQYHHRSLEFQKKVLEAYGFEVAFREIGYLDNENYTSHFLLTLEDILEKKQRHPKRMMIIGTKP